MERMLIGKKSKKLCDVKVEGKVERMLIGKGNMERGEGKEYTPTPR